MVVVAAPRGIMAATAAEMDRFAMASRATMAEDVRYAPQKRGSLAEVFEHLRSMLSQ